LSQSPGTNTIAVLKLRKAMMVVANQEKKTDMIIDSMRVNIIETL
jgi:hypothetical protein